MENIYDKTLTNAKKSCIELLKYRITNHVHLVKDTDRNGSNLVLRDFNTGPTNSLDTLLLLADNIIEAVNKRNNFTTRISEDLVLVKLDPNDAKGDIYYVLSVSGKRSSVLGSTSTAELESNGKILYISKGSDPPEAASSEIIKRYFESDRNIPSSANRYIEMVKNGDLQNLKEGLCDISSIKCDCDEMRWTMLHHAVYSGNLEVLSFLISIGCDAQLDICGRSPVHIAAREGFTDAIQLLLSDDLTLNKADCIGWTPLHYAAWSSSISASSFLIEKQAQVNVKDRCFGKTPLHVATEQGHVDVVRLLLSSGSNINEATCDGDTPLHFAATKGHLSIVKLLTNESADMEAVNKAGWAPLHCAIKEGHFNVVKCLVDKGADPNAAGGNDSTPLHFAAHLNIAMYLLEKGADLESVTTSGFTPLHCAVFAGVWNVAEFFLTKGADLHAKTEFGLTPLHVAASRGHLTMMEHLVDAGACPNAVTKNGWTPLYMVAHTPHPNLRTLYMRRENPFEISGG